ncbi:MAG: polyisoprenoid-binding protein [Alphaproteobacteria bacterium]|nr:polyisoprenoid-binding protein [Alphaproteobacteria bacterium]
MHRKIWFSLVAGAVALAACATSPLPAEPAPPAAVAPVATEATAGTYRLDKAHTTILFRVDHLGISRYTARFLVMDATLELDPANPADAALVATVDARSIETDYPDPETLDFNAALRGAIWLDADAHPEMRFVSTHIEMTGPATARIHGDFTMRGVTRPLMLEATFNGGYAGQAYDRNARIGFSAHGTLMRSAYGMDVGIPPPGSTMGVGDAVEIIIETEFTGPAWAGEATPSPPS